LNFNKWRAMSFSDLYYKHIMLRKSCGSCHFTNLQRPSDITLADFWGWQKTDRKINKDGKGVSLVLVNTEKGREIFDAIRDRLVVIPAEVADCMQPQLQHPAELNPLSDEFEKDYVETGFEAAYRKYTADVKDKSKRGGLKKIRKGIKKIFVLLHLCKGE